MYRTTNLKIEMENEIRATEAIKAINKYLSQLDEKNDYLKEFYNDLQIENNSVITAYTWVFWDDDFIDVLPKIFKAIAQNDPCGNFKGYAYGDFCCAEGEFEATFEGHTLKCNSIYFSENNVYHCPNEDCGEILAHYEDLLENGTFTCPVCGKVYTADELIGERPEIAEETWYIE